MLRMSSARHHSCAGQPKRSLLMRKSREEAARTRQRIIAAAAKEFREHGVVATGLADLMKAAGLTHGGFYKHFASKDELVREVTVAALGETTSRIRLAGE